MELPAGGSRDATFMHHHSCWHGPLSDTAALSHSPPTPARARIPVTLTSSLAHRVDEGRSFAALSLAHYLERLDVCFTSLWKKS